MSRVIFSYTAGRQRVMSERDARILQRLGRGTYQTRTIEDVDAYIKAENAEIIGDGLDDLDAEALHALAKERGVKVHHKAGAEKVREALARGAAK